MTGLVDTAYFDAAIAQLNAVATPFELSEVLSRITPSIATQEAAVVSQIAAYAPALELLTLNPADLPALITFIQKFVAHVLTPQLKPAITLAAQLTALQGKAAEVAAAAAAAAGRVGV